MIAGIIFIIVIASALYFFDDFPKWIESIKKFWKEIPVLYDRNIRTKPKVKRNVTQEEVLKTQQQQMNEAKMGFQDILNSRKPQGYGKEMSIQEKLARVQQQIDNRKSSKPKSVIGKMITDWERRYLWDGISKRKRVPCFHCEVEDMYKGPSDGPSQIWRCPHCGQGVKLTFYSNGIAGFQCQNLGINQDWIK